jgi:hypothetical protein
MKMLKFLSLTLLVIISLCQCDKDTNTPTTELPKLSWGIQTGELNNKTGKITIYRPFTNDGSSGKLSFRVRLKKISDNSVIQEINMSFDVDSNASYRLKSITSGLAVNSNCNLSCTSGMKFKIEIFSQLDGKTTDLNVGIDCYMYMSNCLGFSAAVYQKTGWDALYSTELFVEKQ